MRRTITLVLALLCIVSTSATASTSKIPARCATAVSWQTASHSVGKTVTMSGQVVGAKYLRWKSGKGSMTFLDFGAAYPNPNRFTVVVWNFDASALRGHTACATGQVKRYKGEAELNVDTPSAIVQLH